MSLPFGATLGMGEFQRISDAVEALKKDVHAPREMTVKVTLHVHREYPKHIPLGDGKTIIVNSAEEEAAVKGGK